MGDSDFATAFAALTGQAAPFAWQHRLYHELAAGTTPDAVDVPTGLGKTKVMVLWLIARSSGADLPRRLVYIVDRRTVVDQATEEAESLACRLKSWLRDGNVDSVPRAAQRRNLGLAAGDKLQVSTLRGQFADNRRWLDNPGSTAIVVGTVDMIGSRLLFSGYGVSGGMRPAHAGLLGADTLVVLDEAHLVPPFQALLQQVVEQTRQDRSLAPTPVVPEFRLMALSATGRTTAGARIFSLSAEDEADAAAQVRLRAEKRLTIQSPVGAGDLSNELADRAWRLGEGSASVLVFCNSRMVAQKVASELGERSRKAYGGAVSNVTLLVASAGSTSASGSRILPHWKAR
jgi:CRISPR-associated endonuclease/helicase Cas3